MPEPEASTERYWEGRWRTEKAEIERLRAALMQIASVANHGVNNPAEALARVAALCGIHEQ